VREIEGVMQEKVADVKKALEAHQTFESWGREGLGPPSGSCTSTVS
jgi:hypothetical protein